MYNYNKMKYVRAKIPIGERTMKNTTLIYIEKDGKTLLLHRTKKKNDLNHDLWVGIGGHCEEGESPTRQSREGTCSSHKPPLKWCVPIASVAALTAQPLAALPPYGCGVPFTGSERLRQLRVLQW